MVDIEKAIQKKFPKFEHYPQFVKKPFTYMSKKLMYEEEINSFLEKYNTLESFDFIEAILEYFGFGYSISNKAKRNIPASGRVVIIANHPLGALDALSLISLIKEIRSDVKIVANDILMQVPQLQSLLIPVDNISQSSTKEQIKNVYKALENDEAVIIFPSGEVSRARVTGIKDTYWQKGFLRFAKKTNSPILPVFIEAKNSSFFYTLSALNKKLSGLFLVREMFLQRSKGVSFKVGELIPYKNISKTELSEKMLVNLLKKHLYKISKNKPGIFQTQTSIAHPENRQEIKKELKNAEFLSTTNDGKKIYLAEYEKSPTILKEIGRLREYSFRKVEEGTGSKRDTDSYDKYYKHIVLWDDEELEVVGSYRIGESGFIKQYFEIEGFYSSTLFKYQESFNKYLINSIELGRSFVQPKYWGSRALDYLWQGIGAYLAKNSDVKYMFGPVSLSDMYPKIAKNLLITFYKLYFSPKEEIVVAKNSFFMSKLEKEEARNFFCANDYAADFRILKEQLSHLGLSVPTLYKQYADLCEEGGIEFVDFNVDGDFSNCVDSFIIVDIDKIKEVKRKRYIK
ncbi:lysophospholipid acyltransferase family protein [Sulfurospirillum arcachonense]|uniref:lysophospholipid acyltransferase family protein n=1 Tax=Sulfurospirillum arcachonense TaxID=57666 RepID=UPI0004682239|nr:lysophospholipid acyltransferase family protein [Sulfurospirillum arcachonense]